MIILTYRLDYYRVMNISTQKRNNCETTSEKKSINLKDGKKQISFWFTKKYHNVFIQGQFNPKVLP